MSTHEPPAFELSEEEMAEFRRIASIPDDDLPALVAAANIDVGEFEEFVRQVGLEKDQTCRQIIDALSRQANRATELTRLARVARETVQDRVYSVLRDRLMRGYCEPGQKLQVADLATALGTSALPVRNALRLLIAERALELSSSDSARVPSLSRDSLRDLRGARLAIEGLAVSRAAANMDEATLTRLRELIAARGGTDADPTPERAAEWNRDFCFTIYRRSGSGVLLPIIESLWLQFGPYLRMASERVTSREGQGTNFQLEMVAALARGDAIAARNVLEADIGRSFDLVMADNSFWHEHGGVA